MAFLFTSHAANASIIASVHENKSLLPATYMLILLFNFLWVTFVIVFLLEANLT